MELESIIESCIVTNDLGFAPVESRLHGWAMERLQPTDQSFVAILLIARVAERVSERIYGSKPQALRSATWHVVISVVMLAALLEIVHLPWSLDVVLAGKTVFSNADFERGTLPPWKPFQEVHASVISDHRHGGKYGLTEATIREAFTRT